MLIKDIEPIGDIGVNLLEKDNPDELIDKIVEMPLRKACKILRKKGIETVMSSANHDNVLKFGEKRKEKDDVKNGWMFFSLSTDGWGSSNSTTSFKDAGCGYAWIMLNFDTLSDENKDLLFELEERKDNEGKPIGEKGIWFVHPFKIGNIDYQLRSGKLDCENIQDFLTEGEISSLGNIKKDERLEKFENKSIILSYNERYPTQTVIIRMPIDEKTTVEEVEEYFVKFAELLRMQKKEKQADYGEK